MRASDVRISRTEHNLANGDWRCHWPACKRLRGGYSCWCDLHGDRIRNATKTATTACYEIEWERS